LDRTIQGKGPMRCHRTLRLISKHWFAEIKGIYLQEIITKEADLPALHTVVEYPTTTTVAEPT
jgi:hypothetical protein